MSFPDNLEEPVEANVLSYASEVAEASATFYEISRERPLLLALFLINPIRAMTDAGVRLSRRARKPMRDAYPEMAWDNPELYDQVAAGERRLDFLVGIRLGRPRTAEDIERIQKVLELG